MGFLRTVLYSTLIATGITAGAAGINQLAYRQNCTTQGIETRCTTPRGLFGHESLEIVKGHLEAININDYFGLRKTRIADIDLKDDTVDSIYHRAVKDTLLGRPGLTLYGEEDRECNRSLFKRAKDRLDAAKGQVTQQPAEHAAIELDDLLDKALMKKDIKF